MNRGTTMPDLSENAVKWLASGERGISSNTIFTVLTGFDALSSFGKSHPYDPADLRRCRLLIDACPEIKAKFGEMKNVSKVWARLVEEWDSLCCMMDEEAPRWRNCWGDCPKTYARMKELGC